MHLESAVNVCSCLIIALIAHNVEGAEEDNLNLVDFTMANAVKSDVKFYLFANDTKIDVQDLDVNAPTKFIIHGWLTNEKSPWFDPLKQEYFKRGNYNVVYVDYSSAGNLPFNIATANSKPVGEFISDFIVSSGVDVKKVHLIAHSLGAHVAGFAGKHMYNKTGSKIGRITALDTAGPKFEGAPKSNRLSEDDAEFVDVIHTDDGHFGYTDPHGHADFYPNGGRNQPGCPKSSPNAITADDDNCSHARSTLYFIEAVNSKGFLTKQANSWEDYLSGRYINQDDVILGENVPTHVRGKFYFKTNSSSPFAQGS